jgi:ABC transporter substrate binding protein
MKRRQFIALLGGATAWPLAARAQQPGKMPRIGIIDDSPRWNAFRHRLRDLGYVEGQNIAFDYAYGDGVPERLAEAAAVLVSRPVDVIATYGTPASFAAKQATTTIPIVMISIGDPVRVGLVPSLARPGGNITGNSIIGPDVGAKRVQILKEAIPAISRVAFLWTARIAATGLQPSRARWTLKGRQSSIALTRALGTAFPPPALGECCHCSLARRGITMCGRATFVVPENDCPHPRFPDGCSICFEDAADHDPTREHVEVVVIPFAGRAGSRGPFQEQVVFFHWRPR